MRGEENMPYERVYEMGGKSRKATVEEKKGRE